MQVSVEIKAFIFDLDGVITDTAEYHFLSWKRLADEEGLPFTRQDNEMLRGVSRRESLNRLLKGKQIDEATAQAWMQRKNEYYVGLLNQLTPDDLLPGIRELITAAKAAGLKLAIASASKNANTVLERLQVRELFDAVGDGYSVVNTKPAPDLFIWTAGRLNVSPPNAVVFEDAEAGVEAALVGGFWVVGIGRANVDKAHVLVEKTSDLRFETLMGQLKTITKA
ncbi:MAG TPA: beta-phosphoglucomutase [Oceanobacillus sp.]|nr:beta-phosphoglucomutase [Oceanobacillus sp.]